MPTVPNFPLGEICKWLKHADCKSVLYEFAGSNPALTTILKPTRKSGFFYELQLDASRGAVACMLLLLC